MKSIDPKYKNPKRRVIKTNGSPPKAPVAFVVGERISKGEAIQRINRESNKKANAIRKAEKKIAKSEALLLRTSIRDELRLGPLSKSEIARLPAFNPIRPPKNAVERVARALGADDGTSGRHGSPFLQGGAPGLGR